MPNSSSHTLPPGPRSRRAHPIARSSFATCRPRCAHRSLVRLRLGLVLPRRRWRWRWRRAGGFFVVESRPNQDENSRPARAGPGPAKHERRLRRAGRPRSKAATLRPFRPRRRRPSRPGRNAVAVHASGPSLRVPQDEQFFPPFSLSHAGRRYTFLFTYSTSAT